MLPANQARAAGLKMLRPTAKPLQIEAAAAASNEIRSASSEASSPSSNTPLQLESRRAMTSSMRNHAARD
jgi:hypothetical protein